MTTMTRIRSLTASAVVVAGALTLAACSTGTAATSAPSVAPGAVAPPAVSVAPIDTPSPEPSASEAASPEASTAEATAIPTSIDPCKIVTVDEVNKLTGANFKSGKEETDTNNVKRCTYGEEGVSFMGNAYKRLLSDRDLLRVQLQAYAACGDEDVRQVVREEFAALYELVKRESGATDEAIHQFFAEGMLLNVAAALELGGTPETWSLARLLRPEQLEAISKPGGGV